MAVNGAKFAQLLTEAIRDIKRRKSKKIAIIQDELGYALGKEGRASIEYWRKGHVPVKLTDLEVLTLELVQRAKRDRDWAEIFLLNGGHPYPSAYCNKLFFTESSTTVSSPPFQLKDLTTVPAVAPLPSHSKMPLNPNPLFVGRKRDLLALAQSLMVNRITAVNQVQVAATTGLGGMGKTQLACEFVHRYGQFFTGGVFWFSFEDPKAVPSQVAACGELGALNLFPNFSKLPLKDQINLVKTAWQEPIPRLLIFDNCEDESQLTQWIPTTGGCHVLITTRRATLDPIFNIQAVTLGALHRPDSLKLLKKLTQITDDVLLDQIAQELGDLPLALHLAGSYLRTHQRVIKPTDYLTQLQNPALLNHPSLQSGGLSPTGHEQHVARTFALSYERLDPQHTTDRLATDLLVRIAHFAPGEPIWYTLLVKTLSLPYPESEAALRANEALNRLLALGLIETQKDGRLRMHRLVAAFVRQVAHEQIQTTQKDVERVVFEETARVNDSGYPTPLLSWHLHLRSVTETAVQRHTPHGAWLCRTVAEHFRQIGDYQEANEYLEKAKLILTDLKSDDLHWANTLHDLGCIKRELSELELAQQYLTQAYQTRGQHLSPDHPDIASSHNEIGHLLFIQGDYAQAQERFEQALLISLTQLGREHACTADYHNNLGLTLNRLEQYETALHHLKEALDIRQKVLGTRHPRTALSHNNVGGTLFDLGQLAEAESYYQTALDIRQETLGKQHPRTAESLNNLGYLYYQQKKYEQALPPLEQAIAIRERVYGTDHYLVTISLANLGLTLHEMGQHDQACACFQRCYESRLAAFGRDHTLTQRSLTHLQNC